MKVAIVAQIDSSTASMSHLANTTPSGILAAEPVVGVASGRFGIVARPVGEAAAGAAAVAAAGAAVGAAAGAVYVPAGGST